MTTDAISFAWAEKSIMNHPTFPLFTFEYFDSYVLLPIDNDRTHRLYYKRAYKIDFK